mgnify:CR=1 FL=1
MKTLLFSFTISILFVCSAFAEVVGTFGNTYSIKEADAYEEIIDKVKKHDWQKEFTRINMNLKDKTKVNFKLNRAKENKVFYVDPTYTLEFDITNEKGEIIYPKGYTFNPLQYMQFPYKLIFFNADSVTEMQWLQNQELSKRWDVMLIAVNGDVLHAGKVLNKYVYAASKKMIDKFKIKTTPSILYAQGNLLVVQEVGIYGENNK